MLRIPSINLTNSLSFIIKAFQNPIWAEQARERLKQINNLKRLTFNKAIEPVSPQYLQKTEADNHQGL